MEKLGREASVWAWAKGLFKGIGRDRERSRVHKEEKEGASQKRKGRGLRRNTRGVGTVGRDITDGGGGGLGRYLEEGGGGRVTVLCWADKHIWVAIYHP
jgi:hypothetical protein